MITKLSLPRKYTTTHNDDRAEIYISVGHEYNQLLLNTEEVKNVESQVNGYWDKDRIIMSAVVSSEKNPQFEIRERIIKHELPNVLRGIGTAEYALCTICPHLRCTKIYVDFQSHMEKYNRVEYYGRLEDYLPI
jgi:hypothetical protein